MRKIFLSLVVLIAASYFSIGQTILTQNFEAAWTIPSSLSPAWSGTVTPADNQWQRDDYTTGWAGSSGAYTPAGASATLHSARFHSYDAGSGTTGDFISPVFDLSAFTPGVVKTEFYYINTSGTDVLNIYSSNDGGSTWSAALMGAAGVQAAWTKYTVTLPGNSATTKIKFTATSDWGTTDIGVDEVRIYNPIPANAPPIAFTATAVTQATMTIGWTDNSTNEISFRVYRSSDNITFTQVGTDIASTSTGTTGTLYSQPQTGLNAGVTYYYRIAAVLDLESTYLTGSQTTLPPVPMSGTKTVGPTGDFFTLTAAFQSLNGNGVNGPVNLVLQSTYLSSAEPAFPIPVMTIPGASSTNKIVVYPSATGLSITSASATGTINMTGVTYVTFDGRVNATGTTKNLVIENTNVAGYAIQFINDSRFNTLQYCQIQGVETSTTLGVVLFSTTTGTLGNSNNLIDNCDLKDGVTTPANLIYSAGTPGVPNLSNTVSNCNLFNWFLATTTIQTAAINILAGNSDWTITANSFYQTAVRTYTSSGTVSIINVLNASNGYNFTITNNFFGGTAPSCGGTPMTLTTTTGTLGYRLVALSCANGVPSTFQGNTISNISLTTALTGFYALVYHVNGHINIINNTIGSQTATNNISVTNSGTGAATFCALLAGGGSPFSNINISGNNFGGISVSASSTGSAGGRILYAQAVQGSTLLINNNLIGGTTANSIMQNSNNILTGIMILNPTIGNIITNNTIRNLSHNNIGVTGSITGINVQSNGAHTITGNTIYNLTTNSTNIAINNSASIVGLTMTALTTPGTVVSQNTIYNLVNTNTTVAGGVNGMYFATPTFGQATISRNFVHSFSTASATSVQTGIFVPNTGNAMVYNNMVRLGFDAAGAAQTNSVQINGIYKASTGNVGVYFNSVYIGGTGVVSGAVNSYAYRRIASAPADTVVNNIFINNRSNASGTGKHYGIFTNAADLLCNFNLYQTTGTGGVFGIVNVTDFATIAAWRGGTNLDNASGYGDPNFVLPTGTSTTVDLHVVQSNTAIEAAGTPIAVVTSDYDGAARAGLTPVDIGADAGSFISSGDIFPPNILYTPLTSGTTANRVLTNFAAITDNVAVSGGASLPRLYYKKSGDNNAFVGNTSTDNGWKYVVASNASSPYSFTVNYGIINGGSVVNGDIIQYFVAAQDAANNLSSNFGGAGASGNPPVQNVNAAPATPLSYTIAGTLTSPITVGTGGTYPSLTGVGGAFAAINAGTAAGNLVIQVLSDLTEDGTNALNPLSEDPFGSNFTITIQPNNTTEKVISGAVATGMIRLNGTDRVTIDGRSGGSGKYLRFRNTNTANPTLTLLNDATNNTIRNCYFEGANTGTTSGVVLLSNTTGSTGNDNNTFTQNSIRDRSDAAGVPANLVYSLGTALKENSDITFSSNEFFNFSNAGLFVSATGNGNNWTISGNSFYNNLATAPATTQYSIYFIPGTASSNSTITGNYIGGQAANCVGAAWVNTGAVAFYGIYLTTGIVTPTSVQNNTIQNITMSSISGSSFGGIYITGGDYNVGTITGNTIGHPTTAGSITLAGTTASRAIYNSGTGYINLFNNLCANINRTSTTATVGFRTIEITAGTLNITNNTVRDILSAAPSNWTDYDAACVGIEMRSTLAGQLIENNSIYNLTASDIASTVIVTAHGIRIASGTGSVLRNNIYNIVNLNPGSAANLFGINIAGGIWKIANNLISVGTGSGNQVNISGIYDNNTSINEIYFNSINISGTATSGANNTFAINKNSSSFLTAKDNIFFNQRTGGTGLHCAVKLTTNASFISNYNDLFSTGAQLGMIGASNYANLAAWRTGSGQDANSVSVNPQFVSTTDLHTVKPELNNTGIAIPGITTDYAMVTRSNPPDIGAYEFTGIPDVTTVAATVVGNSTATLNGIVTANNEMVVTGFEYGLTTAYGTTIAGVPATIGGMTPTNFSGNVSGLTPCTVYHFRAKGVVGSTPAYGLDMTFTTTCPLPTVVTTAATLVTAATATLNGTVNANNTTTTVSFDYGLTTAYGTNVAGVPVTITGSIVTASLANITGLAPNTLYHFRINGVNGGGTINGNDLTFTTAAAPPTVTTTAASPIGTTSATLNGIVNANNSSTTVSFEWGLTTGYGNTVAGVPSPVTGSTNTNVSAAIIGLVTNTTYHFRVTGTNSAGTSNGGDLTFLTGCPQPAAAGTITGPVNVCLNGTGYIYTVPAIANATSYVWTLPTGATITAGSNTNSITVSYSGTATSGNVTVYGSSICGNGTVSPNLAVTVNPLPVPTITGPATACAASTGNVYTTQTGMTGYTWTVSAGGVIDAGAGTNSVTVTWNTLGAQTVSVNYINGNGCTAALATSYPVTVNARPVPTVTGPATLCAGSTGNVYTTQTGMTGYVWTLSAGGVITAGAGTNAITVTWNTAGAQTVCVNYTGANGCNAAAPACSNVTVNALPVPSITGSGTVCLNSSGHIYTTQAGMTGYTWTISAGGTILSGSGTNSITTSWSTTGPKTITVNYTNANGCTALTPGSLPVTVDPLPTPTITGPSSVCQGATGVVYTTQAGMTNYNWTVSAGGTITAGGTSTSNTVTVTWTTAGAKTVAVNYTNAFGCSAPISTSYPVSVNATPVPTIGSTNNPCVGSTNNIYYTESGMTGYVWTVSAGGTIVSGQGTSTLNVTWNLLGTQTVSVNYTNTSGCQSPTPAVYTLFVNSPPNAAGAITGTATVCAGTSGVAYSTTPIVGVTSYSWTVPSGATVATGTGTTNITVDFGSSAVTGNVTVAGVNQCGNGPSSSFAVTVNPMPAAAGTITGPASVCAGATGVAYSVGTIANATSYVWTVPVGVVITSGATTKNIVVTFGPGSGVGIITVKGTNACGSGTVSPNFLVTVNEIPAAPVVTVAGNVLTSSAPTGNQWYYEGTAIPGATGQSYTVITNTGNYWCVVTINGCSSPISNKVWVVITGVQELQSSNFSIYPVPNDGQFTVSITSPVAESFTITVYNQLGAKIYELGDVRVNGTFEKQIDLRPIASGVYSVVFLNSEHKVVRKVIVNK